MTIGRLSFLLMTLFTHFVLHAEETIAGFSKDLLLEQIGKFHPLLLHFPLVFISLLPPLFIISRFSWGKLWAPTIPYFLHFASLTIIPTIIAGLCLAYPEGELTEGNLYWHRQLTLVCGGLILLASLYHLISRVNLTKKFSIPLFTLCTLSFLFLIVGAHFGAVVVHGDFLVLFAE